MKEFFDYFWKDILSDYQSLSWLFILISFPVQIILFIGLILATIGYLIAWFMSMILYLIKKLLGKKSER